MVIVPELPSSSGTSDIYVLDGTSFTTRSVSFNEDKLPLLCAFIHFNSGWVTNLISFFIKWVPLISEESKDGFIE